MSEAVRVVVTSGWQDFLASVTRLTIFVSKSSSLFIMVMITSSFVVVVVVLEEAPLVMVAKNVKMKK